MNLNEAIVQIDSLELKDDYDDFSTWTDEALLYVRINIELSSVEKSVRFLDKLRKRNLETQYWDMRKRK